ncbi:MAG: hypothetical protein KAI59_06470, partial [Planctomycetes bacterium]|nr:hypothetical protein [Planctomycetota bacterium]
IINKNNVLLLLFDKNCFPGIPKVNSHLQNKATKNILRQSSKINNAYAHDRLPKSNVSVTI